MPDRFYELAIEGPTGKTLGFVQGFLSARGEGDFANRVLSAMRFEFGGHEEKKSGS